MKDQVLSFYKYYTNQKYFINQSYTRTHMSEQNSKEQNLTKKRQGRWSEPEHQKFVRALEIHGANWKKMKPLFQNRTLSQIRSHAQKYFQKVGQKERIRYQRKAKLLEAEQIKALQEQQCSENRLKFFQKKIQTKQEHQQNEDIQDKYQIDEQIKGIQVEEEFIKEQHLEMSETIAPYNTLLTNSDHKSDAQKNTIKRIQNHGYLYDIFRVHPTLLNYYGLNHGPQFFFYN